MEPHRIAAQHLAKLRGSMSQSEFGRRMDNLGFPMSRQTVWKVENAQRPLTLDEVFAVAYVLGLSPLALLMPEEGEPVEVGHGVVVDRDTFLPWWMHLNHPNPEAVDERFAGAMPEALRSALRGERDSRAFDEAGWSLIYAAAAALRDGDEQAALMAGRAVAALVSDNRTRVARVAVAAEAGDDAALLDALRDVIENVLDPEMVEQYDRQAATNQARAAIKQFEQLGLGAASKKEGER